MNVLIGLQEETKMIDLRDTCVLVRTKEENEKLLKEAEEQGFHWHSKDDCKPLSGQHFPDILKFYNEKDVVHSARIGTERDIFHEASDLLGTKEMTVREFAEWIADACNCTGRSCQECVLDARNTKCNKDLCNIRNLVNNIDEILEIVKSGKFTVCTPEEKVIENIEKLIKIPDHEITEEIKESLKLAVEKLKEVK